jgi:hypothetical protein
MNGFMDGHERFQALAMNGFTARGERFTADHQLFRGSS